MAAEICRKLRNFFMLGQQITLKVITISVSAMLSLAIAEIGLRYLTVFPISRDSNKVTDPRLGYRLSSSLSDVDSHGFRNEDGAWKVAQVAAIGDSHTFGSNVRSESSWPAVFGRLTGMHVYNYGVGSYNLFSYHVLVKNALNRGLKGIIIALYPLNDFESDPKYCVPGGDYVYWSNETKNINISAPINAKECDKIRNYLDQGSDEFFSTNSAIISAFDILIIGRIKEFLTPIPAAGGQRVWRKQNAKVNGDDFFVFPFDMTPLNKQQMRKRTNRMESEVAYMMPNFKKFARSWRDAALSNGVRIGVMIVPSREHVFYGFLQDKMALDQVEPEFRDLMETQNRLETQIEMTLDELGIRNVRVIDDLVPAMQEAISAGGVFYPASDPHPLEAGYEAYAKSAQRLWEKLTDQSIGRLAP